jgi:hypothetical protein
VGADGGASVAAGVAAWADAACPICFTLAAAGVARQEDRLIAGNAG